MWQRIHFITALIIGILLIGGCSAYTPKLVRGMTTDECNREMLRAVPFTCLELMKVEPDGSMVEVWTQHRNLGGYWVTEIHKDPYGNVDHWRYYGQ